jgi:hypothetical protein
MEWGIFEVSFIGEGCEWRQNDRCNFTLEYLCLSGIQRRGGTFEGKMGAWAHEVDFFEGESKNKS